MNPCNRSTGPGAPFLVSWRRCGHHPLMGLLLICLMPSASPGVHSQARFVQTPYEQPKALADVYLDHPDKMGKERYLEVVQRMRYYASQGVKFKVYGLALQDFGYRLPDMQNFVEVATEAIR